MLRDVPNNDLQTQLIPQRDRERGWECETKTRRFSLDLLGHCIRLRCSSRLRIFCSIDFFPENLNFAHKYQMKRAQNGMLRCCYYVSTNSERTGIRRLVWTSLVSPNWSWITVKSKLLLRLANPRSQYLAIDMVLLCDALWKCPSFFWRSLKKAHVSSCAGKSLEKWRNIRADEEGRLIDCMRALRRQNIVA